MSRPAEVAAATADEDIRAYKIHVSHKYLDLTRQKLELTRLPREVPESSSTTWWNPKPTVEPLIDFWVEHYSWRDQENGLNASIPQFRTSIRTSFAELPLRIHFIHSRSRHSNAVPLILIPPFPFTNLSFGHLIDIFTDPGDARVDQPFHLVIPSLPGLGFSDAFPTNIRMIPATADMLNILMKRLGYKHYVASNSGTSATAQAGVDWRIVNYLAINYTESCLGTHFVSPPLKPPNILKSPLEWTKWKLASGLHAPILGYTQDDFKALQKTVKINAKKRDAANFNPLGLVNGYIYEPNTLAYALCDSPTGLLVFFLTIIKMFGSKKEFSPSELITMTSLTWLPGPEGSMRFWAYCESCEEAEETQRKLASKPKVTITVFLGDEEAGQIPEQNTLPLPPDMSYPCPAWAKRQYEVVGTNRVSGRAGLLVWERPEVIVTGVRNLVKALLALDKRLYYGVERLGTAQLEQIVVNGGDRAALTAS